MQDELEVKVIQSDAIIFDKVEYIMPVAAYALLQYVFILIYFSYQNIKRTE